MRPPSSEGSISVVPLKPGSDNRSNFTQSTTSASEWGYDSPNSRSMSISDFSNRSASGRSINSSTGHIPTINGMLMEPLNDTGSGLHHNRDSNNSMGGSFSTRETSNNSSCNSFGESSLSSFLSVLLEDETTKLSDISIVADNPKPEQRSIRDLRLSFIQTAYKNDKPKCRWEYLTRDNNDREQLARSRRRSKLETRSESFSGPINETKQNIRFPSSNSNSSINSNNSKNSSSNKNDSVEGMFLRMPVRKNSPMTEAAKKKSLMLRLNMSDTDLALLPMQPGTSCAGFSPTKGKRNKRRPRHCQHGGSFSGEPGDHSQSHSHSHNSYSHNSHNKVGLSRSGDRKESIGNATWSKADTLRGRRRRKSNQFLDFLVEPESNANENAACWPSPLPSPAVPSASHFALGVSQRQLQLANLSFLSLGESSEEEGEVKNKIKMNKAEKKIPKSPPPRPSSFSKKNVMKQPRRSSDSSIKSSSRKHKDNNHKRNSISTTTKTRSPEICSSKPPQIPTRCTTPKSPRGTIRRKKPQSLSVLPNMPPLSPKSPWKKSPPSSRQRKKRSSVSAIPNSPPLTPKTSRSPTERRKSSPTVTTLSSRTSTTQTQRKKKSSVSNLHDFPALNPKSPPHPKPPKGRWFSPFDYNP